MKSNRKVSLATVILDAFCAVIWTILAIDDVITGSDSRLLAIHIFCAIIWVFIAIMFFIRYKNER